MKELEVGMYVRGKYYAYRGKIGKIIKNYQGELEIAYQDRILKTSVSSFIDDNFDINGKQYKASHNPIDLIEVGDYVNGYKIDYINSKCETPFLRSNQPYRVDNTLYSTLAEKGKDYNQPLHFYNEDIKSIVTKEQFEAMKYIIEK